jgi:hypothetical protein
MLRRVGHRGDCKQVAMSTDERTDDGAPRARPRAAVVACAKNEGVYLHEWIAYHKVIGFDQVFVYDNESTDGSGELLRQLEEHGLVTAVTPWAVAPDVSPQTAAYRDALDRLGEDWGWIGFIDLDEFFVLPRHERIQDLLEQFDGHDALGVNWKNFGSSGHERYSPDLVIDRFRRCSAPTYGRNARVKVLAPTKVLAAPGVHKPKLKKPARFVDVTGQKVLDGRSQAVNHDVIRLNHYYTKSLEEWQWKATRGRGGKPESVGERKHWYPDFEVRDRNEDKEVDIVKRLPALRELMERTKPTAEVTLPPATRPPSAATGDRPPPTSSEPPRLPGDSDLSMSEAEAADLAAQAVPALEQLGWLASRKRRRPVTARARPMPWFTFPTTAFLVPRLRPDMRVFEFGGGYSTLWWGHYVEHVSSVEQDQAVATERGRQAPGNATLLLSDEGEYAEAAVRSPDGPFDIVVIGGQDRVACALNSLSALRDDGVLIWNNSERREYSPGIGQLVDQGFKRLAFVGMGPKYARLWETTIFYQPENCLGI